MLFALSASPTVRLSAQADPDRAIAGGGGVPSGYHARTDRNAAMTNVKVTTMGTGMHFTLGPAVIVWRDADAATGDYHVVASFTQTKAPTHPEAYGLFIGGHDLAGPTQGYTYFLVRGDGKFLIKRRVGDSTVVVNPGGWTANDAVVKADSAGKATNELSILVSGGNVKFMVNGKEVYTAKASDVDAVGVVGLRVNHNLDVHVGPLGVHKM
ncbi:MAG: hypothetical protein DMD29_14055 [Gemmatimonadetes bacterium]|nr:MAG: hypothetical protein DMD29_14055 [Gemmatimonadota bacterium]